MSTKWVVTAASERVTLDGQRKGEIAFTVTNPTNASDRAVFDVIPGDGAEPGWFSVEDPQRLVRGGASVAYLMKVAVPATTAPGTYPVQGLVYSADSAPEESSVLSPRVALTVAAEPEPVAKRKWPWWWLLVAAGLVAVVLIVVGVLVFTGGGDEPAAPPALGEVTMPDLAGMSEREALNTLSDLGLAVRPIAYRHDPERADTVVHQSLPAGEPVSVDAVVDLEVAVEFAPPVIVAPVGAAIIDDPSEKGTGGGYPREISGVTLQWSSAQAQVRRWRVQLEMYMCGGSFPTTYEGVRYACGFPDPPVTVDVDTPSLTPEYPQLPVSGYYTGWVRWQVWPLDDFGSPGPASEPAAFYAPRL